jgi:hypothetical protein
MTEPFTPAAPEDHALHDPVWMAALASRDPDLSESERTRAEAALRSCDVCAELFAELVAVSAAIPAAALPARPRDFTLTAADAARLRPGGLRRWLAGIGSVRDGITFPLAMGLTTMGIAGLLLATVPAAFSGMGGAAAGPAVLSTVGAALPAPEAAAPAPAASGRAAAAASAAAPSAAPAAGGYTDLYSSSSPDTEITGDGGVFSGADGDAASQAAQRQDAAEMRADATIQDDGSGVSTLLVVALTLLIAGLGLFALRWTSRRLGDG